MFKYFLLLPILFLIFNCDPRDEIDCILFFKVFKNNVNLKIKGHCTRYSGRTQYYQTVFVYPNENEEKKYFQTSSFYINVYNKSEFTTCDIDFSEYIINLQLDKYSCEYITDNIVDTSEKIKVLSKINILKKDFDWVSDTILDCEIYVDKHPNFNNEPVTIKIKIVKDKSKDDE